MVKIEADRVYKLKGCISSRTIIKIQFVESETSHFMLHANFAMFFC